MPEASHPRFFDPPQRPFPVTLAFGKIGNGNGKDLRIGLLNVNRRFEIRDFAWYCYDRSKVPLFCLDGP